MGAGEKRKPLKPTEHAVEAHVYLRIQKTKNRDDPNQTVTRGGKAIGQLITASKDEEKIPRERRLTTLGLHTPLLCCEMQKDSQPTPVQQTSA